MQDRYAFDVGDFGKFGLLRHLAEARPLGVLWYATSLASAGNDGKHLGYLDLGNSTGRLSRYARRLRECDEHLFDVFRETMHRRETRSIDNLQKLELLPASTRFHGAPVSLGEEERHKWFIGALEAVRENAIVFCDPDNGIANPDSENELSASRKHARLSEIEDLHSRGHGVVMYHHLSRKKGGHGREIGTWLSILRDRISPDTAVVRFRRGTSRAFFVIPGHRAPDLVQRLETLCDSVWVKNGHLEFVESGPH